MEITKANLFLCLKEWDGLSGATAEGEWFLWGPPEAVGNTDFLSSQSPHTSQGPEPTSSQILIWMWALKVLVKNQIVNLRLLVPFRRKEQLPRQVCVYAHIQEWLAQSFSFVCLGTVSALMSAADTSLLLSAAQDQVCLGLCGKQLGNTKPTKSSIIFSMFSYKSQVAPCTEYAFFFFEY